MTSDARAYFQWLYGTADRIREEAGHDAAKFEALLDDPTLAHDALAKFPDDPLLYSLLKEYLYPERLLARRGIFFIDLPPADDAHAGVGEEGQREEGADDDSRNADESS